MLEVFRRLLEIADCSFGVPLDFIILSRLLFLF
jgi:hypothetical protein